MKSTVIQIRGERTTVFIESLCKQIGVESELIKIIHKLYPNTPFSLSEQVRNQFIAHFVPKGSLRLGKTTHNSLKVQISRLIKAGALIKNGRLIGLASYFKDVDNIEAVVIRVRE